MIFFTIDDIEYKVLITDEPGEGTMPFTLVDGSTLHLHTPVPAV